MAALRVLSPASRPCSTKPRRHSPNRWSEHFSDDIGLIISSISYRDRSPPPVQPKPAVEQSPRKLGVVEEPQTPLFLIVGKQQLLTTLPATRLSITRQRRPLSRNLHPLLTAKPKSPPLRKPAVLLKPAFKIQPKVLTRRMETKPRVESQPWPAGWEAVSGWEV